MAKKKNEKAPKPDQWIFALEFHLADTEGFRDKILIPYPFMPLAAFGRFEGQIERMLMAIWGVEDAHGLFESKDPNGDPYQYDIRSRFKEDSNQSIWTLTRRINGRKLVTESEDILEIFQAFEADVV